MIHITKGQASDFYVTLQEKAVNNYGATVFYLININNDMTKKNWWSYGAQVRYPRYTKFTVNDSIGTPPVPLVDEGFSTYKIYEVTSNTIDISDVDNVAVTASQLVEQGKCFIVDNNVTEVQYNQYTPAASNNILNKNNQYIKI